MLKQKEYEINELIFEDESTLIYSGYSKRKKENVSFKTITSEKVTLENIERFKHEYMITQKVNSVEGVLKIYALEDIQNRPVLVKEGFTGISLGRFIKNKKIFIEEFLDIAIQLVHILNEIHKKRVIHLNINPSNILINSKGLIKVIDFGSSILMTKNSSQKQNTNLVEGALAYIAPEQISRTQKIVDYRADYYSLGVTFYKLLTGDLPFDDTDHLELIYSHIAKEALSPSDLNNSIPKVISDVIMKLMSKMPENRYQSLTCLKKDLERSRESLASLGYIKFFQIGHDDFSDRFQICQNLYGRDKEIETLLNTYERVRKGEKELVLINGCTGIGKTALVNKMQNHVLKSLVFFITGKFEQFQKDIPYSALTIALDSLINQLLLEPPKQLESWRERILKAVGKNGQVLIDIIPSLELIIGSQPKIPELGITETQNRLNLVFLNFIQTIGCKEKPLIIFIDDWQWADFASLDIIKMIMMDDAIQYLLIIGAYRNNNVELIQPIQPLIDALIENESVISIINLEPFDKKVVDLLLKNTLISSINNLEKFSSFIYDKTGGNPFFLKQFFQSLYDKEYIHFDYDLMQWHWNAEEAKKLNITDNVVELLVGKINTLNPMTIKVLKQAASIGYQFDLNTLTSINKPHDSIESHLQQAVDNSLIIIIKNRNNQIIYQFVHDQIQSAVYSMMDDNMRKNTHLYIGRTMLKSYNEFGGNEQLFEAVSQLNKAKNIIRDAEEYLQLANLNFEAGIAAKNSSAFKYAFTYLKMGIDILGPNAWKEQYDLTLKIYSEITEMAYLIGDFNQMNYFSEIILTNAKMILDQVKVYNTKLHAYQAQLKLKEALHLGISFLNLLGINIPSNPSNEDVNQALANAKEAMNTIGIENLSNIPMTTDPKQLAIMQILLGTLPTTYKAAPNLTPLLASKMVELSIKYGNSPFSIPGYCFFGIMLCSGIKEIEQGYQLGKLAVNLVQKDEMQPYKAQVLEIDNFCIRHWKKHLRSTVNSFIEGFKSGIEYGDFQFGGYCLSGHAKNSFYAGRPLGVLEKEIITHIKSLEKIKQGISLNNTKSFGQLVCNMQGKSDNPVELTGEICNENKMLSTLQKVGDIPGLTFLLLSKSILYYFFDKKRLAVQTLKKVEEKISGVAGMIDVVIFNFFDSLSSLSIYPMASEKEKKDILMRVSKNQENMDIWSKHAPMNFLHKYYLIEAERLRVIGSCDEAIEYYNRSIALAKQHEYVNDEALANELVGQFWMSKNKHHYAKLHFKEAHLCYELWGAEAKAKDLEINYPQFLKEKHIENTTEIATIVMPLDQLDVHTIMKANQTISQEIVLDDLIKRLIRIIIENLGAQKVVFLIKEENQFIVKGKKEIEEEKITITHDIINHESNNVPQSIIHYVARKKEAVIIDDAIYSTRFALDKYIIKKKCRSILCFPLIHQGELKGIIYLENNLITGTFTKGRLKILEMLSSQIVISYENAKLYKALESSNEILEAKVKERTAQLKIERDKLKKYLNISEAVYVVLDKNGNITMINNKGCEILESDEKEVLGENLIDNYIEKAEDRKKIRELHCALINKKTTYYSEQIIKTKTGRERKFICTSNILQDEKGNYDGLLISALDITERETLREELEYSRIKLELFSNLSHELKTPLNLSFSALQMLNYHMNHSRSECNSKYKKYTNIIKQNNYRLLKLVNNLIDIIKINSNSYDLNLQSYDIVDMVKTIVFSIEDYTSNKHRKLEFNSNIDSKIILCDAFSIERIILNLLSNAVKFTDEGDKISVCILDMKDSISIIIKDTGIGVSKEKLEVIFDRFRQVDKSFTRRNEGSGLGLTIVKLLVELHDGTVTVDSQVNQFTEFIVKIPVKKLSIDSRIKNYTAIEQTLIDRIDVEFSDVYGL